MKFLYFKSSDEAWLRAANGYSLTPMHTTSEWGRMLKHPQRAEWCVAVREDYLSRIQEAIAPGELGTKAHGPFTEAEMLQDGWQL